MKKNFCIECGRMPVTLNEFFKVKRVDNGNGGTEYIDPFRKVGLKVFLYVKKYIVS